MSLPDSQEKWGKALYQEPKATEPIHYLHKVQNDHPEANKGAIHPGQWAISLNIKSAYCHIPVARRHHCFLCFQWKGKVY